MGNSYAYLYMENNNKENLFLFFKKQPKNYRFICKIGDRKFLHLSF
jgi:hypothetical protein